MASSKELKAIISIAGTIDPSLSKAINQATKMTGGLGTALRVADGVFKVGGAAMAAGTAAAIGFGKASIDAGMEFDSSMSQVAATMGTTVDQITDLRDYAQEMGATTAFSATEAADALNYMALAGYDAEESMNMLPTVLDLAAAGNIEIARASDMVTDAQSALGLSAEETKDMVDQMAKASSKSNTSVEQLGDAYLKIGATARNVKGGTEELATVLGVLADNGIKGEKGGTHLRNMILSLQNPTEKG
ncbi:MAG: phage tail tape measure protein, partial [Lachnospiraceae bacterium]|nr:phage tail tape measure protein [Lachnospiraceae bacterium]